MWNAKWHKLLKLLWCLPNIQSSQINTRTWRRLRKQCLPTMSPQDVVETSYSCGFGGTQIAAWRFQSQVIWCTNLGSKNFHEVGEGARDAPSGNNWRPDVNLQIVRYDLMRPKLAEIKLFRAVTVRGFFERCKKRRPRRKRVRRSYQTA